jgi:SAM-dependent methyltransferase
MKHELPNTANAWDAAYYGDRDLREQLYYIALEEKGARWRRTHAAITARFDRVEGLRTLELGAGSGIASAVLARLGAKVTLLDFSAKALDMARRFYAALGIHDAEFIVGDVLGMDTALRSQFDVCLSHGMVEHFMTDEERLTAVRAHTEVLSPRGQAFVTVPYAYCVPLRLWHWIADPIRGRGLVQVRYFSKREFRGIARQLGLETSFFGNSVFHVYNPLHIMQLRFTRHHDFDPSRIATVPLTPLDNYLCSFITCQLQRPVA